MAKYCGTIGFVESVEKKPGVFEYDIKEKKYRGDVLRDTRRWEGRENLLDNVNISNILSILANDSYSLNHCFAIRYAWWKGCCWEVTSIEIARPRLILTLGGVYNGPRRNSEEESDNSFEHEERVLPAPREC